MQKPRAQDDIKLTFLGTGTSQGVPVIGCECQVCSSISSKDKRLRTSVLVSSPYFNIAIDAGPDFRQQMLRAKVRHLDALLITHEHNDHIVGLDDVRPFNFSSGRDLPVYATREVGNAIKERFKYIFAPNPYPGAPRIELKILDPNRNFKINNQAIIPINVMHGSMPVLGFRFGEIVYITDAKTIAEEELKKLENCEHLVLNALHHSKHHSHLNLEEALSIISKVKPKKAYLTHISHRMGLNDEVNLSLPENVMLAYDGLQIG